MAVLGRLKIAPNQRLDLPDIIAFDAYSAGDWKGFMQAMVGTNPYIIKGFEVFQPQTLIGNPAGTVDIVVLDSSLWWAESPEGSFFVSLPEAENQTVTLITDATNFIEMKLTLGSRAEDARALWDPGANGGAGGEFTQVVDTENFIDIEISRNNTGFSEDKIPIAKVVVNSSNNVTSITDCRPLYFRLGSGGTTPDPLHSFPWEDDPVGYSRTDTPVTMTSPLDPNIFRGADKNIATEKDWKDAVMSRIKEIDGGSKWFQGSGGGGGGSISLVNLFLDSQSGHSPQPDRGVTFAWSKLNDNKLRSENAVGYTAPARWKANFGQMKWALGGTFVSATDRAFATTIFEIAAADGENVYLHLQRDAALNGDPTVHFENLSGVTGAASSTGSGAFTGIACGDFIRKDSGSHFQYYRVAELRVSAGTPFPSGTTEGTVADATVQYLIIDTHDGPILTSDEKYRYFRTQYQQSDLVASTYGFYDSSYYWLGRRFGTMFYLRDYGDLQPGEEVEILDDSSSHEHGGGASDLTFEKAYDSVYDPTTGYSLKGGGLTTLLTIRRRVQDNTVGVPSNVDNSQALPTYTIAAPVGTMVDGDGLWVRLGPTAGALTSGDVTDTSTPNVWEIRDAADTPLRTYDNRIVFLVARKFTIGGVECLVFSDGAMMSFDGQWVNNHLSVQGDLFLKNKTQWSVPFIGTTGGRVDQNNAEFFWNNTSGTDSLGVLGVRNLRFTEDTVNVRDVIDQGTPQDHWFLPNIGSYTIRIGGATSTTYIPGDLIVDGTTSSIATNTLQVDDKVISLGVGNLLDGGFGTGIEVADDTRSATQIDSTNTQDYIDITYGAAHPYTLGDALNIDSNTACGGITAGEMAGTYTVVAVAAAPGDAEVISPTVLRIWTNGTATSTASVVLAPPTTQVRSFEAPWSFRLGDSSGVYGGITSWVFRVKGQATAPTLTPVSSYGIVPTAHSSNMQAMRIAFVNNDNAGPAGADTTLDFDPEFTWDAATGTFTVGGDIVPFLDNTYDLGTTSLRWKTLHVGPGSVVVHNDATDTNKISIDFSGSIGRLVSDAATSVRVTVGSFTGINVDTGGRTGLSGLADSSAVVTIDNAGANILAGSVQHGIYLRPYGDGSNTLYGLRVANQIAPATATTASVAVQVDSVSLGAGATVSNEYGVRVGGLSTGTVAVYAIYTDVTDAAPRWNIYEAGSAPNYFNGFVGFGQNTKANLTSRLNIGDNADTTASGGIKWGATGLSNIYRSAADTLRTDGHFIVGSSLTVYGTASFSSGFAWRYGTVQTASYSVLATDTIVPVDTSAAVADVTMNLPAVSAGNKGQIYIFKDVGGVCSQTNKRIILDGNGSETIDGSLTYIMENDYASITLVSNGLTGWDVI